MAKFKITWGSGTSNQTIPEDNGWTWSSEQISEPIPRYFFAKVAGANGYVDLSKSASGSLLYDERTITVTFARFKKGQDAWRADADTLTDAIRTAFATTVSGVYVYPKTQNKGYKAYGFNAEVSRDGIIQFVTLTFKCAPIGFTPS